MVLIKDGKWTTKGDGSIAAYLTINGSASLLRETSMEEYTAAASPSVWIACGVSVEITAF